MSHILVVEDDPYNAILIRKVLEKRGGHRVTVTEDGHEALTLVTGGSIDLVVMDVSLANTKLDGQHVTGVDLCLRLKAVRPDVPVVLATAHAMRGDEESLMVESGADDYVAKPIVDHSAFVDLVNRNLAEAA